MFAVALCEHPTDKRWWQNSYMSHHVRDLCGSQRHNVIRVFPKLIFPEFIELSDKKIATHMIVLNFQHIVWQFNTVPHSHQVTSNKRVVQIDPSSSSSEDSLNSMRVVLY